jgi:hypothetical protein
MLKFGDTLFLVTDFLGIFHHTSFFNPLFINKKPELCTQYKPGKLPHQCNPVFFYVCTGEFL